MSKWPLLLSSIALVAYVGYSLVFLPSKMEQNSVIPLNTERLDLLEKEIQNSTEPEANYATQQPPNYHISYIKHLRLIPTLQKYFWDMVNASFA